MRASTHGGFQALTLTLLLGGCGTIVGIGDIPAAVEGGPDAKSGDDTGTSGTSGSSGSSGSGGTSGSSGVDANASSTDGSSGSGSGSGSSGGSASSGSSSGGSSSSSSSSGSGSDGGTSGPPSCSPGGAGMTNCGSSSESCCTSLDVPGGTFYRTYSNSGSGPTGEADPATVSDFRLDKYDVTVGRFRQFVSTWKAGWTPPIGGGTHVHVNGGLGLAGSTDAGASYESGWQSSFNASVAPTDTNLACDSGLTFSTWTTAAGGRENLPIDCANWFEAYAFCIWDGGFLPSVAEWEYAAAGGSQQREYAWGTTGPGTTSQYAIYRCYYPNGSGPGTCSSVANIAPVGTASLGAGRWGQLDLDGNVYQWLFDWHPSAGAEFFNPCSDCANLAASPYRAVRGDNYNDPVYTPFINGSVTTTRATDGFRCARPPS